MPEYVEGLSDQLISEFAMDICLPGVSTRRRFDVADLREPGAGHFQAGLSPRLAPLPKKSSRTNPEGFSHAMQFVLSKEGCPMLKPSAKRKPFELDP